MFVFSLIWLSLYEAPDPLGSDTEKDETAQLEPLPEAASREMAELEKGSTGASRSNPNGNVEKEGSQTDGGKVTLDGGAPGQPTGAANEASQVGVEPAEALETTVPVEADGSLAKEGGDGTVIPSLERKSIGSKFTLPPSSLEESGSSGSETQPPRASRPPPNTLARAKASGVSPSLQRFRHGTSVTMRCKEGTILTIPAGAFEYQDGTPLPADAPVQVEVEEFYELYDILMAGLTTHGPDGVLETGGMLHVSATSFGRPLRMVSGKSIQLVFPSDPKKTEGMELYHGVEQESAVEWVKAALPKPTEKVTVQSPIKPLPASLVLMDGSLSGQRLETTVKSNRKLDLDKDRKGNDTLSGTAHVWGSLAKKRIGGTALFSNGVWLMKFQDKSTPQPSLRINAFHQSATPPNANEWFDSKKEASPSSLSLEVPSSSNAFVFRTPPLRPETKVEIRFPWGTMKPAQNDKKTAFFVKHQSGERGGFTTHLGCLGGFAEVSGQTGKGRRTHKLRKGEVLVLGRNPAKATYSSNPKRTLDSNFEDWEYGSKVYPEWHKKVPLDKVFETQPGSVASYANRTFSMGDYYRSVQEEPMRRIERQFAMTELGWSNLDKPGQRESAAKVQVEATQSDSLGDVSTPIVRAVYEGSSSCVLIDGKRFVPSGKALLVAVAYHPTTLAPKLDYLPVSFRPGDNQFKLALGAKSPDDFRQVVSNWKNGR